MEKKEQTTLEVGPVEEIKADIPLSKPVILPNGKYTNPWKTWSEKGFKELMKLVFSIDFLKFLTQKP